MGLALPVTQTKCLLTGRPAFLKRSATRVSLVRVSRVLPLLEMTVTRVLLRSRPSSVAAASSGSTLEIKWTFLFFRANAELRDWWIQSAAVKRLGEPVDVAKVCLFLATDEAAFVSGQEFLVDGGAAQLP